jgi:Ca2+-binding EF-hand superfamily protein
VKRLLERYDANKDGFLTATEIGLGREEFGALDVDGDGKLSAQELEKWPLRTPDLELLVPLGKTATKERLRVLPLAGNARPLATELVEETGGLTTLVGGARLELLTRLGKTTNLTAGRRAAESLFSKADTNDDTVLDTQEIYRDPFEFVGLLRLADRNGDGKLSKAELTAYLDLQEQLLSCSTFLTLSDRGRSLFELLDRDHDARLNPHEAKSAWERLQPYDADKDGCISLEELPRMFLLTLSHGQTRVFDEQNDRLTYGRALQIGDRPRGPLWFRKMDRNRDGVVSQREFLGSIADFKKLDLNGDGFLTAEEADKAEANLRPK